MAIDTHRSGVAPSDGPARQRSRLAVWASVALLAAILLAWLVALAPLA